MNRIKIFLFVTILITCLLFTISCNSFQSQKSVVMADSYNKISPEFNSDSAYLFVEKQVSFGPRVPGTKSHELCGNYLAGKLTDFGAEVYQQYADFTHYNGQNIQIRNIIGAYNPIAEKRILLFAHWDSRPFADGESDTERQQQPILGADDGASGIGVLLEIARHLQLKQVEIGVDIIFFDLEDWGQPTFATDWVDGDWWCVGSRYWSEQPHIENYSADFGILLDMVGGANATFLKEGYSMQYAPNVVNMIWSTASKLGYNNYFSAQSGGYITDDHVAVNQFERAPSANIINLKTDTRTGFSQYWHTHNDDMRNIDRNTLKVVGQTVLEIIYIEDLKK